MARRSDHSPEALRELILKAARKIIKTKGLKSLTARAVAQEIGYAPGTIYNFFKDMEALIGEVNYITLKQLRDLCLERIEAAPDGYPKVRALAHAYVDFAHNNVALWDTIFARAEKMGTKKKLPTAYEDLVSSLFAVIETTLAQHLKMPVKAARTAGPLLWACLHGIAVLTLDGRLQLVGVDKPHKIIDDLTDHYFASYLKKL